MGNEGKRFVTVRTRTQRDAIGLFQTKLNRMQAIAVSSSSSDAEREYAEMAIELLIEKGVENTAKTVPTKPSTRRVGPDSTTAHQIQQTKENTLQSTAVAKKPLQKKVANGTATAADHKKLAGIVKREDAVSGKSKPSVTPKAPAAPKKKQIAPFSKEGQQRLRKLFKQKQVHSSDGTYRGDKSVVSVKSYNAELRRQVKALTTADKRVLLNDWEKRTAAISKMHSAAKTHALTRVENLTTGAILPGSRQPLERAIHETIRQRSNSDIGKRAGNSCDSVAIDASNKASRVRVIGNRKPTNSQQVRPDGTIVYTSQKKIARQKGAGQRAEARVAARKVRAANKLARDALNLRTVIKRRARHAVTEANRRAKENIVAINKKIQSQIKIAKKVDSLLGKKRTLKQVLKHTGASASDYRQGRGYLSKPASQLLPPRKAAKVARSVAGPKNAYPPMNHAGPKGKGPRSLIGKAMRASVSGKMSITHAPYHGTGGHSPAPYDLFSTKQTMKIPGRSMTGTTNKSGLMMGMNMNARIIINGDRTVADLQHKFPRAVKQAIVAASDLVGRRMLDIIEPYVPKDRGYMYQSGASNADQADTGMIGFANGVAFPAAERYGVTISYNTPYSEIVYFGGDRHGAKYNQHHGIQEKGPLETARWIEVAFAKQQMEFRSLLAIYATHITGALNSVSSTRGMKATVG